jgi:hypothetical protein
MPNISLAVPETEQSIYRPIIIDVVNQLKKATGIPFEFKVLFPGTGQAPYQPGSAISQKDQDPTQFMNDDMVEIEAEENYNMDSMGTTAVYETEHLPIFRDESLSVMMKPIYIRSDVTLTFKYRSNSNTGIRRWRDEMRMKVSHLRENLLHDITYQYLIPYQYIFILREIHRLRENVAGYGEDFDTYFRSYSTSRLTTLTNQIGSYREFSIAEKQMRIVGMFDFDVVPDKPEGDKDNQTSTISFTYKFSYEKPSLCNMYYPVIIHNQVLSTQYRNEESSYNLRNHLKSYPMSLNALSNFEVDSPQYTSSATDRIMIPSFDEFLPRNILPYTKMLFSVLCEVDPNDDKMLLNLTELGDYEIKPVIIDFLKAKEYIYLNRPYQSPFQIVLYRNTEMVASGSITVDKDLNVRSTTSLDLRTINRVMFCIVNDLGVLSSAAKERIRENPQAAKEIIKTVNETKNPVRIDQIDKIDTDSKGRPRPKIPIDEFLIIVDPLDPKEHKRQLKTRFVGMKTVMTNILQAYAYDEKDLANKNKIRV